MERKLEELEDKGLIRILRGADGDAILGIEVTPLVVETTAAPSITIEAPSSTSTGMLPHGLKTGDHQFNYFVAETSSSQCLASTGLYHSEEGKGWKLPP